MLQGGVIMSDNVILFTGKRRKNTMRNYEDELRIANRERKNENMLNVEEWSDRLWHECGLCDRYSPTPIIKIAKKFGFEVFQTPQLKQKYDGIICVDSPWYVEQHYERLILVDTFKELQHQRFVIAHELGHYLFEYIGSAFEKEHREFVRPYKKNNHVDLAEQQANRFASCILMPSNIFAAEYNNLALQGKDAFYITRYLARFFEVKDESIQKRKIEVFER